MRKHFLAGLLAAVAIVPGAALAEDQFSSFGIQQVGKLITNPTLFVYEFQRNTESTFPVPPGKALEFQTHLLGGLIVIPLPDISTAYNFTVKARVHPEGRLLPGMPQIDLVAGQWKSLLGSVVEDPDAQPTDSQTSLTNFDVDGHYMAAVISSSLEPRVRLFWSYKMSKLNMDIRLNKPWEVFAGTTIQNFSGTMEEHTFAAGLEHAYADGKRWYIEGGYGIKNHLLTAKVGRSGRFIDLGLNIYPESVFIMQPQLNFHVSF
jgi:hypothetical protein